MFTTILAGINNLLEQVGLYINQRDTRAGQIVDWLKAIEKAIKGISVGGSCGGDEIDPKPIDNFPDPETDPPPEDFQTWDVYLEYKCKVANVLTTHAKTWFFDASVRDWDSYFEIGLEAVVAVALTSVTAVSLTALGFAVSAGIITVAGVAILLAVALVSTTVDLADMATVMDVNYDDLVCSLYESGGTEGARTAFLLVCENGGMTTLELKVMEYWLTNYDVNKLFEFNAEIADSDYEPNYDCSGCDEQSPVPTGFYWGINIGVVDGGTVENGDEIVFGQTYTIDSQWYSSGGKKREQIWVTIGNEFGANSDVTIEILTIAGWVAHPHGSLKSQLIENKAGVDLVSLPNTSPPITGSWVAYNVQILSEETNPMQTTFRFTAPT